MRFEICGNQFVKDGKNIKIISGAVHYFRNLPDTWDDIFEKMKACGFNTVETYCVWNMHEKVKGDFDFSGRYDLVSFLEKAQAHDLMIILRPGPYICAEWEFGGLPWWLLAEKDLEIRCSNDTYTYYLQRYLKEIFSRVKPFLSTNGGNLIMMQVENEYGYYGDDKAYLTNLARFYRDEGIDIPLVTSDGGGRAHLLDGAIDGCLSTLNFGSRVEEQFKIHDEMFPNVPKMCMEMWNGWFDAWGDEKHHTTDVETYAQVVDDMLQRGSLNTYMFIGGTNFGFTSGANHSDKFYPTITSYDYDALLSECGDVTKKYYAVRKVIQKYLDKELPEVPQNREKRAYGRVKAVGVADLFENLDALSAPIDCHIPKAMEDFGFGYGYVLYRTTLNRVYENAKISFENIADRAHIYINNILLDTIYVNNPPYETNFSANQFDTMSILCENMGRTNFGGKMMRKKGIVGRCYMDDKVHFNWQAYHLPMDNLDKITFKAISTKQENSSKTFYKFIFNVKESPCDTFLKTDNFKKGFAVLNGFNLGRYWELGPQKTLYVPASVLKEGENELILFDSDGLNGEPVVEFVSTPDLGPL